MNWGGKFLNKMWCFVGGGCNKVVVFFHQSEQFALMKGSKSQLKKLFIVANLHYQLIW